jgi:hypothetical protein
VKRKNMGGMEDMSGCQISSNNLPVYPRDRIFKKNDEKKNKM